jgi:hypothetical protein
MAGRLAAADRSLSAIRRDGLLWIEAHDGSCPERASTADWVGGGSGMGAGEVAFAERTGAAGVAPDRAAASFSFIVSGRPDARVGGSGLGSARSLGISWGLSGGAVVEPGPAGRFLAAASFACIDIERPDGGVAPTSGVGCGGETEGDSLDFEVAGSAAGRFLAAANFSRSESGRPELAEDGPRLARGLRDSSAGRLSAGPSSAVAGGSTGVDPESGSTGPDDRTAAMISLTLGRLAIRGALFHVGAERGEEEGPSVRRRTRALVRPTGSTRARSMSRLDSKPIGGRRFGPVEIPITRNRSARLTGERPPSIEPIRLRGDRIPGDAKPIRRTRERQSAPLFGPAPPGLSQVKSNCSRSLEISWSRSVR